MLIVNVRRVLMSALWFMLILAGSRILVAALIGGIAGAGMGAVEGYEAGRAASAAFFAEYRWVFLPLAMIISAALFGRLPGTTAKAPPLEKTLIYVDYTFAWHMAKSLTATVIISLLTLSQVAIAGQAYRTN
jgi:ABC-type dipeptide/oligopeptide/nickel transport system permease component